jgi:hypothetical protein
MKYRKKPVVIDAVQFNGFGSDGFVIFDDGKTPRPHWLIEAIGSALLFFGEPNTLTVKTLEGAIHASVGDYIIRGVEGELYPCKPDIFEKTYDKVEEEN